MAKNIGFLLLCISWLIPLHFLPWVSWHSEFIAFLAGLSLLLPLINKKNISIPKSTIIFIALFSIATIQTIFGYLNQPIDLFFITIYILLCIAAIIRGAYDGIKIKAIYDNSSSPLEIAAWAILAGALTSSFIALAQILDIWENSSLIARMSFVRRPGGNLAQPNHLGSLLLLGLGSLIYLREQRRIRTSVLFLSIFVICTAIAATESRTALLGILIFGAWTLIGNHQKMISLEKYKITIIISMAILLFSTWPLIMINLGVFSDGATINAQKGLRPIVWTQLAYAVLQRPWFGWGIKQVSSAHNSVADLFSVSEPFSYAHNIIIELAIGIGIPATLTILIIAFIWFSKAIKNNYSIHTWYCIQILFVLGLHSMLEFPYAYAYFLIPAMYAVGILDALHGKIKIIATPEKSLNIFLIIAFSFLIWSAPKYLEKEEAFRIARFQALHITRPTTGVNADDFGIFHQLSDLNKSTKLIISPDITSLDIESLKRTALQFPWPATQSRYALALALSGNHIEASRQLQAIRAMHGEKIYQNIVTSWKDLSQETYPELSKIRYSEKSHCIYWPCLAP